ncbi:MAG: peptidylprolyl isomerase [Bacteriovoracaceae bacterium]
MQRSSKRIYMHILLFLISIFSMNLFAQTKPVVIIDTNMGKIEVELNAEKAPETVKNFLGYVDAKFYDGTIFHRVIDGFMIQGGGFVEGMKEKATRKPIQNEASNGLLNEVGTIAMARTNDPHSATAQFFINVANNSALDYKSSTPTGWGYAVFGRVLNGMHVVNRIKMVKVGRIGPHSDVPMDTVLINSIKRK